MNNLVYIVMDSCRHDTYLAARTTNLDRLGRVEKRYSYASWTSPSHFTLLMGMIPHKNPKYVYASEVYKEDYREWNTRLGVSNMEFRSFVPELSLPKVCQKLGWRTVGRVSLPVLNEFTTFSKFFDDYKLMEDHNDFAGMVREISFSASQPAFIFSISEKHIIPICLKNLKPQSYMDFTAF